MKKLLLTSVLTASLLTPFAASALIIDHFDSGAIHITDGPGGGSAWSGYVVGDGVGGTRDVTATQVGGVIPAGVSADMIPPASILSLSSKDGADASWAIAYSGGGGGINPPSNFSAGGALGIFILFGSADVGGGLVSMQAGDQPGNFRFTSTQAVPVGGTTMFFPFASFTLGGGAVVDFSKVTYFEVDIQGVNSYDTSIDLLDTRERGLLPDATGTMALMAIAFGLLGAARLKMKS